MGKRRRVKRSKRDDRISDLPDSLLCKILSFLPTKNVVGTCILSKRWKNLNPFGIVPICLDLDGSSLLQREGNESKLHLSTSFVAFVNKLLNETLLDVPCIESMSLKCEYFYENEDIISWVSSALRYNVREHVLNIEEPEDELFRSLHGCTALVNFKITSGSLDIPDNFNLPCLKRLCITGVLVYGKDRSVNELINGCPVLEELEITRCDFLSARSVPISIRSPLLKNLSITKTMNRYYETGLELHAPNLETFVFRNYIAFECSISTLNSLIKAHVVFYEADDNYDVGFLVDVDRQTVNTNLAKIVAACSNTKSLHLSRYSLAALQLSAMRLPEFQNLTTLTIGRVLNSEGWVMFARLLLIAPNLENLVFEEGFVEHKGVFSGFESLLPKPPLCLELHLREIKFEVFEEKEDELKLVEYFLRNGKVVQKLILHCLPFKKTKTSRLLMLPKYSKIYFQPR